MDQPDWEDNFDRELLQHCVRGLSYLVEDEETGATHYRKTVDCVECLKDIQRFLREDDPTKRPAFFELHQMDLARSDLVPLLHKYSDEEDVVTNVVKVATFLSLPASADSDAIHKQVECMKRFKLAFLRKGILGRAIAGTLCSLQSSSRMTEQAALAVQLVLAFIRNLLCIPNLPSDTGGKAELLTALFDNNVMDLLIILSQQIRQARLRPDAALLLEIFSKVFYGLEAKQLASAKCLSPQAEGTPSESPSTTRPDREGPRGIVQRGRMHGSQPMLRHPRMQPMFMNVNPQHPGRIRILRATPVSKGLPDLPCHKPKTKLLVAEESRSALPPKLMLMLREFLQQFLALGYGPLMETIREKLEPGLGVSRLDPEDFLRFVQLARLCTSFTFIQQETVAREKARKRKAASQDASEKADAQQILEQSAFASISATMGWETFHLVETLWHSALAHPSSKQKDWQLQHAALSLLKEMLLVLDLAHQVGSPADHNAADRLMHRLLHDDQKESGLLPVLARMLKSFSFRYQPRSHAAEIVEAIHITLRLLERLSTTGGKFIVKRKAIARKRKPAGSPSPAAEPPDAEGEGQQGEADGKQEPLEADPAASEHAALGEGIQDNAAQARSGNLAEDTNPTIAPEPAQQDAESSGAPAQHHRDPFDEMEEEEEEQLRLEATKEVAYNLNQRVRQELAHPAAVHIYSWLLRGYKSNSHLLNHAIAAFFKRIASKKALNLEPMLYQVSVMRVFQQILSDADFRRALQSSELISFCTSVVRSLLARLVPPKQANEAQQEGRNAGADEVSSDVDEQEVQAKLRSIMYVELLFWKNQREAEDVRDEYNWQHVIRPRAQSEGRSRSQSPAPGPAPGLALSSGQREQLLQLFEQHGMEKRYLDTITERFQEGWPRARVARSLKAMGLKKGVLTENQRERLQALYEEYRGKRGHLQLIADSMPGSFRKAQIGVQLRKLELHGAKGQRRSSLSSSSDAAADGSSGSDPEDAIQSASQKSKKQHASSRSKKKTVADWSDDDTASEGLAGLRGQHGSELESGEQSDKAGTDEAFESLPQAQTRTGDLSAQAAEQRALQPLHGSTSSSPCIMQEQGAEAQRGEISPLKELGNSCRLDATLNSKRRRLEKKKAAVEFDREGLEDI